MLKRKPRCEGKIRILIENARTQDYDTCVEKLCPCSTVFVFQFGIPLVRIGNMLRRILSCLLLGLFCCTLAACGSKPEAPTTKTIKENPIETAKQTGGSPLKPAVE